MNITDDERLKILEANKLTVFVDAVNGDDANDGSPDHPVRTIKRASELFGRERPMIRFAPGQCWKEPLTPRSDMAGKEKP